MEIPFVCRFAVSGAPIYTTSTTDYYTAAVVELATSRTSNNVTNENLIENVDVYIEYISNASLSQVDIIVFPEGGLTESVEVGDISGATPCNITAYHQVLATLSCAARQYSMYVVVTLPEIYNNAFNKTHLFTTSLVFNRNGTVTARYRKYHPYGKSATKPPLELTYFETDFGVTFGMLISFDIQFLEPGIVLARDRGIKHFVFPNCWVSALPFFTAVQTQWAWAYGLDVVLLASGCNDPLHGGTGSGVYLGRQGALQYLQTSHSTSTMLVARVPKYLVSSLPQNNSLFLLRDYVDVYESRLLMSTEDVKSLLPSGPVENSSVEVRVATDTTVCHNQLCCDFQLKVSTNFSTTPADPPRADDFSTSSYRLVAFDGVRSYGGGVATGGIQVCAIIPCVNESLSSCAMPALSAQFVKLGPLYKVSTVFEAITISTTILYNSTFVYPDILVTGSGYSYGALVSSDIFSFVASDPLNGSQRVTLKEENELSSIRP
ncbi:vanin-like protein 1 [Macrosteles quadrilineatus]|uniref:vanin-like protein 1 n=1 Tax=Macrosteles quadrilineatus TaxID=74068 RepID=UPI0023E2E188|nr:vanin-like protein 1 [Macrosteles quadrilineatus]